MRYITVVGDVKGDRVTIDDWTTFLNRKYDYVGKHYLLLKRDSLGAYIILRAVRVK